ncbi:unnamed protein product (mitochondrion) [Plasmodiophora brassicae]|uniref:HECT-type E3 ubiquitin transferase n=1 Tax=Plasmodiophora brassicae TaxID=37360 RepID=A0A0G4J229_PLABS|nr:hypothetical protein PBRA_002020 [Plasmodiophora brassicae]SPR01429.1 unnamed protein product [Plasmodiophora brassicae]
MENGRATEPMETRLRSRVIAYYNMLHSGCGNAGCTNANCASNPAFSALSSQVALQRAIELVKEDAPLCRVGSPTDPSGLISLVESSPVAVVKEHVQQVFANSRSICESFPRATEALGPVVATFSALQSLNDASVTEALLQRLQRIGSLTADRIDNVTLLAIYIVLQNEMFLDPSSHSVLRTLFDALHTVTRAQREQLERWMSQTSSSDIGRMVAIVQTFISVKWALGPRMDEIGPAARFLGIVYSANVHMGEPVPYTEFHNELVNAELDVKQDFIDWHESDGFCFSRSPYLLNAATKSSLMQFDAMLQMRDQLDEALMRYLFHHSMDGPAPFLILQVRRSDLVADTLHQIQGRNSDDFKKPLKVKFIGEDGIDEGGIQKEFFQLLVKQLFNPAYGMFIVDDETHTYWFNKDSFESKHEYELIGAMLGLAIYNSVILDLHFPLCVYKKLLNSPVSFDDLRSFNPSLHRGLQQLRDFDGDVESVFCLTFSIEYSLFGEVKRVELCPNGQNIPVTKENRERYVELFTEYTLNTSIETQFSAFKYGFEMVCGGAWLHLFRPEELELAICGSPELDFHALEAAAKYENYTRDSPVIVNFWKVVHEMTEEQKRRFLSFCTGSDRVPINGLGSLRVPFIIARNGGDSDRLPTSHTCFNHLLLPAYSTLGKLRERLLTAIQNSEGFGLM